MAHKHLFTAILWLGIICSTSCQKRSEEPLKIEIPEQRDGSREQLVPCLITTEMLQLYQELSGSESRYFIPVVGPIPNTDPIISWDDYNNLKNNLIQLQSIPFLLKNVKTGLYITSNQNGRSFKLEKKIDDPRSQPDQLFQVSVKHQHLSSRSSFFLSSIRNGANKIGLGQKRNDPDTYYPVMMPEDTSDPFLLWDIIPEQDGSIYIQNEYHVERINNFPLRSVMSATNNGQEVCISSPNGENSQKFQIEYTTPFNLIDITYSEKAPKHTLSPVDNPALEREASLYKKIKEIEVKRSILNPSNSYMETSIRFDTTYYVSSRFNDRNYINFNILDLSDQLFTTPTIRNNQIVFQTSSLEGEVPGVPYKWYSSTPFTAQSEVPIRLSPRTQAVICYKYKIYQISTKYRATLITTDTEDSPITAYINGDWSGEVLVDDGEHNIKISRISLDTNERSNFTISYNKGGSTLRSYQNNKYINI